VIFSTCRETITDSDVQNYMEMLAQDIAFSPAYSHLIDCSEVTSFDVSSALVRSAAGKKLFSSRAKCAIVAPQDYIFGMARMFQMQQHGELEVFRTLMEALAWLGIGETPVPAAAARPVSPPLHKSA
jgi:hypothetical protein